MADFLNVVAELARPKKSKASFATTGAPSTKKLTSWAKQVSSAKFRQSKLCSYNLDTTEARG